MFHSKSPQTSSVKIKTLENITCPCCFTGYEIEKLQIPVRNNSSASCTPERFTVNGYPIYEDGEEASCYVCPKCGFYIPLRFLEKPSIYISIAGVPESGKTCYMIFMYHELTRCAGQKFKFDFSRADLYSNDILGRQYRTLFNSSDYFAIEKTAISGEHYNYNYSKPYIFEVNPRKKDGKFDSAPLYINFYDQAGEDWTNLQTPSSRFRHLKNSQNLIFLFYDPFQTDYSKITPWELVTSLKEKIQRPNPKVAVIVSKMDLWFEHLERQIRKDQKRMPREWKPLHKNSCEETTFFTFEEKIQEISEEVRNLLESNPHHMRFLNAIDDLTPDSVFIPVTASGCQAVRTDSGENQFWKGDINPVWVEMPILYALAQNGYTKDYFTPEFHEMEEM